MTIIKDIDDASLPFIMAQRELSACLHYLCKVRGELQNCDLNLNRQIRQAVACPRGRSLPLCRKKDRLRSPSAFSSWRGRRPRWEGPPQLSFFPLFAPLVEGPGKQQAAWQLDRRGARLPIAAWTLATAPTLSWTQPRSRRRSSGMPGAWRQLHVSPWSAFHAGAD